MLQHISLLMIMLMVGLLCASLWEKEPAETIKQTQALRVKKVAIMPFHD